jgi:hypothetical protein
VHAEAQAPCTRGVSRRRCRASAPWGAIRSARRRSTRVSITEAWPHVPSPHDREPPGRRPLTWAGQRRRGRRAGQERVRTPPSKLSLEPAHPASVELSGH